ncbi:RagB/SusD family nutrient uptake outer membrane protein [Membranihabitans maritimus]|uniref:RagB/SusD family nutrient uptake outer membrane protein n=1 Tax=Membranihabitans maritimus TaxID=2904244 RepID=UPI001F2F84DB|nr:RagB/SusD family nutrient uptake outer membrane protein [Membranihabitans maritimus]
MKKYILLLLLTILMTTGCKDYLDVKPEKNLVVPRSLEDLARLTDNILILNYWYPALGLWASDELLTDDAGWAGLSSTVEKNTYIWDYSKGLETISEWTASYENVFYANVILEELNRLEVPSANKQDLYNKVRGRALFFRAQAFFNLTSLFTLPYEQSNSDRQLGIVLKRSSNIDKQPPRASLQNTYNQIIKDLQDAISLLPEEETLPNRPDKNAVHGLLSRIYLQIGEYESALTHISKINEVPLELMDYNLLDSTESYTIPFPNSEILFQARATNYSFRGNNLVYVNPQLIELYEKDDLRKSIFFTKNEYEEYNFRGSYLGGRNIFGGISLNEIYLTRSECLIRIGEVEEGLSFLNQLLEYRYKKGTFQPITGLSQEEALNRVLEERRKELVFRHNRWLDLRRLNRDEDSETTISRSLNGKTYQLLPHSNGYVFPIPVDEIQLTKIEQNPL